MGLVQWPASLSPSSDNKRSPVEQQLVRRLDVFLMTFGCISQIIKYLDQTSINNAYVSGMQEDLDLQGEELNYFSTAFQVAYCVMLIPSQIIMTYVRPSLWLSGLEVTWGLVTGMMALVRNAKHVYVLRVFLGLLESSAWPGMMTLLMHWYTPTELAKRMGFYHSCQAVGSMMAGAIMSAISDSLGGASGLESWRWMFVITAIMTVVWGLLGFSMIPDYPNNPNPLSFWFNKATHGEMALARLVRHKRAEPDKVTWASVGRTLSSWVVYFISALYVCTVLCTYGVSYINLFFDGLTYPDGSPRWKTVQVNAIPIGSSAINIVFVWFWAILSDVLQTRWPLIVAQMVINIIPCTIMTIWTAKPDTTPLAGAYFSYFVQNVSLGTAPLIFSWLSDLLPQDPEARSLTVGIAVALFYAISSWSQALLWPASEAPYYSIGWQTTLGLTAVAIVLTLSLRFIDDKFVRPKREAFQATMEEVQHIEEKAEVKN